MKTRTVVFLISFSMAACTPKPSTQEPKESVESRQMPDYKSGTVFIGQSFVKNKKGGARCNLLVQKYSKGNKDKYQVAFPGFELGILPFGIYDFESKVLMIDNKDKNGDKRPDGFIDETTENPSNRNVFTDHPYCK